MESKGVEAPIGGPPGNESLELSAVRLAAIVESCDDAIIGCDLQGTIVSWNRAAEQIFGYQAEEAIGRHLSLIAPEDKLESMQSILERVKRGEKVDHFETVRMRKGGQHRNVSLTVSPIRDFSGKIVGASKIARDITELRAKAATERFLQEATMELSSSLEFKTTLENVARLAIRELADWAAVDIVEDDGRPKRLAVAHEDPEKEKWAWEIYRRWPPDMNAPAGVPKVLRTGEPELIPILEDSMLDDLVADPELRDIVRQAQIRSVMIVPLPARGRTLGALTFVSSTAGRFGQEDLTLAMELGRRAALAVDNAQLFKAAHDEIEERRKAEIALARHVDELSLLYEAGRVLGSTLEPESIYRSLQQLISRTMDAENMVVSTYDETTKTIRCEFALVDGKEIDPSSLPPIHLNPESPGMQTKVIMSGESVLIADAAPELTAPGANYIDVDSSGTTKEIKDAKDVHVRSILMVPMKLENRVFGVMQVMSHEVSAYDKDDLRRLEGILTQMSAAARNALLYQQARTAEARYRSLVSAMSSVQWSTDAEGCFQEPQEGWQRFTGQSAHECAGKGWQKAVHPTDQPNAFSAIESSLASGRPLAFEARIWNAGSNQYRYCLARAVAMRDADGRIAEWVGTLSDVHDRRKAEERSKFLISFNDRIRSARSPEQILHALVNVLGEQLSANGCTFGEFSHDQRTFKIHEGYANGVKSIAGIYPQLEHKPKSMEYLLAGRPVVVGDIESPEFRHMATEESIATMRSMEIAAYMAVPMPYGDGVTGVISVQSRTPRIWTNDEIDLMLEAGERANLAVQSVLARQKIEQINQELERRVEERTAELEAANREMEGFTYTVSHDLRAPLRSVMSSSMILVEDFAPELSEDARALLYRQAAAASKLDRLIDDVLRLSRLARAEMNFTDIDLSAMARDLIGELSAREKTKEVVSEVEPGIHVPGDPQLLGLVLQNLFENAIKFSQQGSPAEIRVGFKNGVIMVRDRGIGFDQQYVHKIFAPFERLHRDEDYPGTGIGLANVKRIIERHGGKVWAEGAPGQGATFFLCLPNAELRAVDASVF